jgi:mono/diheme cytochrome c family protein
VQPNKNDAEINGDSVFFVRKVPAAFPLTVDFLHRGQERFNIYCAPCHGESGYGDGMIANRVAELQKKNPDAVNGWAAPQNFHEAKILARPDGHIYNTITNGIRNMPGYGSQVPVADRWAIVSYIRTLQLSEHATQADLSPDELRQLNNPNAKENAAPGHE